MFFASDNCAGAHPKISKSLEAHSAGYASSYGNSEIDKKVADKFREIFECDLAVFFVSTGTAANSLALASAAIAGGVTLCHSEAHVIEDECGAPEFFTGSGRLAPVRGKHGKIDPANLESAFSKFDPDFVHHGRPMAATITQATEAGTLYALDEISAIAEIVHRNNVPLHMDGARFANAVVGLDTSPADMTWRRGVDLLSFGGTKNGCWCAEALICFDTEKARNLGFLQKRSAQLFSKSRFVAAQFDAYLHDGLWLELASHSNAMAEKLYNGLLQLPKVKIAWQPQANELFVVMKKARARQLRDQGAVFFEFPHPVDFESEINSDEDIFRFVTSFATKGNDVEKFIAMLEIDQ